MSGVEAAGEKLKPRLCDWLLFSGLSRTMVVLDTTSKPVRVLAAPEPPCVNSKSSTPPFPEPAALSRAVTPSRSTMTDPPRADCRSSWDASADPGPYSTDSVSASSGSSGHTERKLASNPP